MKKLINFSGMILVCVFALTACQTPSVSHYPQGQGQQQANQCIPEWVKNPNDTADAVYGTGEAKLLNHALSLEAADSRARTQIVKAISTKVSARFKDFMQQLGTGENAQSLQVVEAISKHISSETLHGCKIIKREFCPDGKIWSLAILPQSEVNQIKSDTKQKAQKFVVSQEALYNEFKAKQAFDDFQKDLDKMNFSQ